MKNKKTSEKIKLVLSFSIIIFILFLLAAYWLIIFYSFFKKAPFIDIEDLPEHTTDILLGIISFLLGIILSVFYKKFFLDPIYQIYTALDAISEGNYKIKIAPYGLKFIRRLLKKVNSTVIELESVEKMRNDFIDNFSHEFKTPIISISGFAKMLKNQDINESERKEYLDIIISESERLSMLATNVLELTKLNSQSVLNNVSEFNLSEQIRLVIVLLENKWTKKNINISFIGNEYFINGCEEILKQLWINVIDNAIKYSPDNSAIEIKATEKSSKIIVTVKDQGPGMDELTARHAFDRFFQGDISHKANGNGIGLAMAKKICDLHEGDIIIKKTGVEGTVFQITLPCHR